MYAFVNNYISTMFIWKFLVKDEKKMCTFVSRSGFFFLYAYPDMTDALMLTGNKGSKVTRWQEFYNDWKIIRNENLK